MERWPALVTPVEKKDTRAHQPATVRPLKALRTVADARRIPVAASIHNHSAPPGPTRGSIALAFVRHGPPPNRTEQAQRKPGPRSSRSYSGGSMRAKAPV